MATQSNRENEDNNNSNEPVPDRNEAEKNIYKLIDISNSPVFWTKFNKIKLIRLNEAFKGEKFNLFNISIAIVNEKIDLARLANDDNDDNIDFWKYTTNIVNGKLDLSKLTDSKHGIINLETLSGVINNDGDIDFTKIFDSKNQNKINLRSINTYMFFDGGKLDLSKITTSYNYETIDLFEIPECITNGKIDLCKLKNSQSDMKIDLIKYTRNTANGKIDLNLLTDSQSKLIDVYNINELVDSEGRLDLYKIFDSSLNGKIDLSITNFKNYFDESIKKITINSFTDSGNGGKIDLFQLNALIVNGKINIDMICNSCEDDKIDFFKYTRNLKDGQIDLGILISNNNESGFDCRLEQIFDKLGRLDLARITDSTLGGAIDLAKLNFWGLDRTKQKYLLNKFCDSKNNDKIDLFKLSNVLSNGKIDVELICNAVDDNMIDFFKYTQNLKDGKIDLGILMSSSLSGLIYPCHFNGLFYQNKYMDLAKITDSTTSGVIYINKKLHPWFQASLAACLGNSDSAGIDITKFFDSGNYKCKINLFKIGDVVTRGKIDISQIAHVWKNVRLPDEEVVNRYIDILAHTIHHNDEGKILVDSFRDGKNNYFYLSSLNEFDHECYFAQSNNVGRFHTAWYNIYNYYEYDY